MIQVDFFQWTEVKSEVMDLRRKGFSKFGLTEGDLVDVFDPSESCMHLVARGRDGALIGCSRLVFGLIHDLPIARLTNLAAVTELSSLPLAEASRFCVPPHPSAQDAKFGLWRLGLHLAMARHAGKIVLSTRLAGARSYERMLFQNFGEPGRYRHEKRGGREHVSLYLDLGSVRERFRSRPQLFDYFFAGGEVPRLVRGDHDDDSSEIRVVQPLIISRPGSSCER
jgi:hypothetical protein